MHDYLFNAKTAFPLNGYICEAYAQLTDRLSQISLSGATRKKDGIYCCIPKKIAIPYNHWESFAPTHDFLFNAKTAFPLNGYIYDEAYAQPINHLSQISLCGATKK
ncbi:MAG: hypothetical protein F6K39_29665 [Okeania sp. SIO3B3]|nr:hypothetical protein [Okeania sp. SIO3B3]